MTTEIEDEDMHQTVEVLSSIPQGRTLRDDAKALGWKPNHKFKGKLILAAKAAKPVTLWRPEGDGGRPDAAASYWRCRSSMTNGCVPRRRRKRSRPKRRWRHFVDESVPNLSSIVVLAELGGKSMLLTGDARGDKILEGMELAGLLKKGGKRHVDLLKVPHHGSDNNMETIFFERVTGRSLRLLRRWRAWQPGTCHAANAAGCAGRRRRLHDSSDLSGRGDRCGTEGGMGREAGAGESPEEEKSGIQERGAGGLVARETRPGRVLQEQSKNGKRSSPSSIRASRI